MMPFPQDQLQTGHFICKAIYGPEREQNGGSMTMSHWDLKAAIFKQGHFCLQGWNRFPKMEA